MERPPEKGTDRQPETGGERPPGRNGNRLPGTDGERGDHAAVATAAASAYFRQALYGTTEPAADRRVVDLLGALGRSDPRTWAALTVLRANPTDPVATAALEQRIAEVARRDQVFRDALARTLHGEW
ncbi:hypothetical protein [Symbioplanes lichenis]|uniref:hypothetical protein n=1 Tax=Symbioplanes lichenis TaxID=1629072 RepID=UPI0027395C8B|nr:hypothetical protein [Actinoplanes lichenis]